MRYNKVFYIQRFFDDGHFDGIRSSTRMLAMIAIIPTTFAHYSTKYKNGIEQSSPYQVKEKSSL